MFKLRQNLIVVEFDSYMAHLVLPLSCGRKAPGKWVFFHTDSE